MQTQDKFELFHSWPPTDVLIINQTQQIDIYLIYYYSYYNNLD